MAIWQKYMAIIPGRQLAQHVDVCYYLSFRCVCHIVYKFNCIHILRYLLYLLQNFILYMLLTLALFDEYIIMIHCARPIHCVRRRERVRVCVCVLVCVCVEQGRERS